MSAVNNWNQKIQEEIQEIELLIEAEELNLQINEQIRKFTLELSDFSKPTKRSLLDQKEFILNSIKILKRQALVLHNKKIFCI